jgi:2-phosphoglycerate kinase
MDSNALYKSLSARITAEVLGREQEQWPSYFDDLRAMVRRVVTEANESGLSVDERSALTQQLVEHVVSLEACLPKLRPTNTARLDGVG